MKIIPLSVCFSFLLHLLLPHFHVRAQNNEVHALLSIKNAVGGSASNITYWDSSAWNPCNWTGVTCSSSLNRVISLNMSGLGLQGTLPSYAFTSFMDLTSLDLSNNLLTSPLPSMSMLTQLHDLNLSSNAFDEEFPNDILTLKELVELRISNNKFHGSIPDKISTLTKLQELNSTCNYLQGTIPPFPKNSTWTGNCFDSDKYTHSKVCNDNISCKKFYEEDMELFWFDVVMVSWTIFGVIGIMVILCGIIGLLWWLKRFCTTKHHMRLRNDEDIDDWEVPPGVKRYTYKEIMKATKSFNKDCEIGEGGFGKVYLAQVDGNKQVAIKRASDMSFQGIKEFRNEIMLLNRLHHRHLVQLNGFCDDKNEQILVYEYMKNGNLHRHLFDKDASALNWYRRLEIALGVAQGLEYLHTFADPPVIHRDMKPSNILLDGNMIAKVSDFGISKANPEMDTHISTRPAGTFGYLDPEYFLRRQLTTASDVYGYGVVLLELLTSQLAIDHKRTEDYNLVAWVNKKLNLNGDVSAIIDPRLGSKYPLDEYSEAIEIAVQCTRYDKNDRPKMQAVAASLEQILRRLQPPAEHMMILPPPSLTSLLLDNAHDQTTNSLNDIKITYASEVEPR